MIKNLPIWRDANRFLLAIEKTVKQFPRYHKYTLGTELRNNALQICNLINRAWQQKQYAMGAGMHRNGQQCELLLQLKILIDEVKIQLHLAKKLQAIKHFTTFEWLAKQAVQLGKQNGGWYKARCK